MLTLTILKSGWGPWLIKQKISAYEALFLFGGKFLLWLVGCLGFDPRLAFWVKIQALRWGLHAWGKGKGVPSPEGSRRFRLPDFLTFGTWRWWVRQPHAPAAFTPRNVPGTHFHYGLSRPQGHGAVGRKYVTEKYSGTTGSRSQDRPTSSTAP